MNKSDHYEMLRVSKFQTVSPSMVPNQMWNSILNVVLEFLQQNQPFI